MSNLGRLIDNQSKKEYHHGSHSYRDVPPK